MDLEELAEASGVSARTIRYYQTKKLLPPPARDTSDGRVSRYGAEHLERLRLIGELRDRGLKLPAIRDLLDAGDPGARVADWLGLDDSLRGAWDPVEPQLVDAEALAAQLAATPAGTRSLLVESGLLRRQGTAWLVPNPPLLALTIGLIADGVHTDLVLEAGSILRDELGDAADRLIDLFVKALGTGFGGPLDSDLAEGSDPRALVESLRPIAGDAARLIFQQQLERAIAGLLADTRRLRR